MKIALATVAGLAISATASAQVIDLSGVGTTGVLTAVGSTVTPGAVTMIQFDLSVMTNGGSWGSEVNIDISGPGGFLFTADGAETDFSDDGPDDLTFGWGDFSGTFTFSGTVAVVGGAGTYTVSVVEDFDDAPAFDATFKNGSTITLIPTPGTAAILGLGAASMIRRRR